MKIYHCDFETTTTAPTQVWLWAIIADNEKYHGTNIVSFLKKAKELATVYSNAKKWAKDKRNKNRIGKPEFHFFNLNFDGAFIVDHLLNCGYVAVPHHSELGLFQFSCLYISKIFYNIKINIDNITVSIYCSLQYLGGSIKLWGEALNCKKGITPLLQKPPEKIKDEWLEYIYQDCTIAQKAQQLVYDLGLKKRTIPGNAFQSWKDMVGSATRMNLYGCDWDYGELIDAYKGAICLTNKKYEYKEIEQTLYQYDIKSAYGWAMLQPMPYGKAKEFVRLSAVKPDDLYVVHFLKLKYKLKEGCQMLVQINHRYNDEYEGECMLSSVDWGIIQDCCTIGVQKVERVYLFEKKNNMFKTYVDYWYSTKETSDFAPLRIIGKAMLTNLYGKIATKRSQLFYIPQLDNSGRVVYTYEENIRIGEYLPVGIFVTAYIRKKIYDTIVTNGWDNWVYSDTDSYIGFKKIKNIGKAIGQWKLEKTLAKAMFTIPKRYKAIDAKTGKMIVRFAGIKSDALEGVSYEKLQFKNQNFTRKYMSTVPGGKIMVETKIKVRQKNEK